MKVSVTYDQYNTSIESAEIKLSEGITYALETLPIDEVNLEKRMEIKAINELNTDGIPFQMTHAEAKQFQLLISQFVVQLQQKTV